MTCDLYHITWWCSCWQVPAAVAPVDVLLHIDQGIGLIRFHDSAIVHRVKLVGRRQDALLSFNTYRWRTLRSKYQRECRVGCERLPAQLCK